MAKSKAPNNTPKSTPVSHAETLKELSTTMSVLFQHIQQELVNANKDIKAYEPIEKLGDIVTRIRKEQKVSLKVLATLSSVSVGTIQSIEQGKKSVSLDNTIKVLGILGKKVWIL